MNLKSGNKALRGWIRPPSSRTILLLSSIVSGLLALMWLAIKAAPHLDEGLIGLLLKDTGFAEDLQKPFGFVWVPRTRWVVLTVVALYALALAYLTSVRKNTRPGEEYGSAKWLSPNVLRRTYGQDPKRDKILSKNVAMGLDMRKLQRNLNLAAIGGPGTGKTRYFVLPNLYQANSSYIVLDPAGELYRDTAAFFKKQGYRVLCLNLSEPLQSQHYNPFSYLHEEKDVDTLVEVFMKATTPIGSKTSDPFWDMANAALLSALIHLSWRHGHSSDQTFGSLTELLELADVDENNPNAQSSLDLLFAELEIYEGDTLAVRKYRVFKQASGKTAKSILVTLAVRLQLFTLPELAYITSDDELALQTFGERRTILYLNTPAEDGSLNFLVSMLYMQLFQQLYRAAKKYPGALLPVPVQFWMDEFANVPLPPDFTKIQSTCRKYNISVNIIIQSLGQLQELYKDSWKTIIDNCDTLLFLGGSELETTKYLSDMLGKETLDTNTFGRSKGKSGSFTTNDQQTGRELLTAAEIRELENTELLIFIRGHKPCKDRKYILERHPHHKEVLACFHNEFAHEHVTTTPFPITENPDFQAYQIHTADDFN